MAIAKLVPLKRESQKEDQAIKKNYRMNCSKVNVPGKVN